MIQRNKKCAYCFDIVRNCCPSVVEKLQNYVCSRFICIFFNINSVHTATLYFGSTIQPLYNGIQRFYPKNRIRINTTNNASNYYKYIDWTNWYKLTSPLSIAQYTVRGPEKKHFKMSVRYSTLRIHCHFKKPDQSE
jgi:hypothetical protein